MLPSSSLGSGHDGSELLLSLGDVVLVTWSPCNSSRICLSARPYWKQSETEQMTRKTLAAQTSVYRYMCIYVHLFARSQNCIDDTYTLERKMYLLTFMILWQSKFTHQNPRMKLWSKVWGKVRWYLNLQTVCVFSTTVSALFCPRGCYLLKTNRFNFISR